MEKEYWIRFWKDEDRIKDKNPHVQVGRSINKTPIENKRWQFTLSLIERTINLQSSDNILDLCAGNGLLSIPFSQKCISVTAVDVSQKLIAQIDTKVKNIETMVDDVRNIDFKESSFSKIILYFALQHFSNRETVVLFEEVYKWLKKGGLFFIGDIPDQEKLWNYFNNQERERVYFESIRNETPIIGNWFTKTFLLKLAKHSNYSEYRIITQHKKMINSHYRFDMLLAK